MDSLVVGPQSMNSLFPAPWRAIEGLSLGADPTGVGDALSSGRQMGGGPGQPTPADHLKGSFMLLSVKTESIAGA